MSACELIEKHSFLFLPAMEAEMLASRLSFFELLNQVLEKWDEEESTNEEARYRPGGKVDLYILGDDQWLEQFR